MKNLPIACELTTAELQARRRTVLQTIRASVLEVKEIENGFAYPFSSTGEHLNELARLIDLERRCCPFLRFQLTVGLGGAPLALETIGPEGTKDFLLTTFDWNSHE